jgi:glutathione S-transferase
MSDDLPQVTAFAWVPPFARGQVRDLRVRWALEELDRPYTVRLLSGPERPKNYFHEQPWGQVPAYREGDLRLFECGAIALHIAESDPEGRLLPRDPVARLGRLADWLGQKDWLEDRFSVGDLLMVATLRSIDDAELLGRHPTLAAYVARGEARPPFQRALAAQMADFVPDPA